MQPALVQPALVQQTQVHPQRQQQNHFWRRMGTWYLARGPTFCALAGPSAPAAAAGAGRLPPLPTGAARSFQVLLLSLQGLLPMYLPCISFRACRNSAAASTHPLTRGSAQPRSQACQQTCCQAAGCLLVSCSRHTARGKLLAQRRTCLGGACTDRRLPLCCVGHCVHVQLTFAKSPPSSKLTMPKPFDFLVFLSRIT